MSALKRLGIAVRFEPDRRSIQGMLAEPLADLKFLYLFLGVLGILSQAGCGNTVEQSQAASTVQVSNENPGVDTMPTPLSAELRSPPAQPVSRDDGDFVAYEYR